MNWSTKYPFVILLIPVIVVLLLSRYTGRPFDLFADTDVSYLDSTAVFSVHVISPIQETGSSYHADVVIESVYLHDTIFPADDRAVVYFYPDSAHPMLPIAGDVLMVRTVFSRPSPHFPDYFDYGTYLRNIHKIGIASFHSDSWTVVDHREITGLRARAEAIRNCLIERYAAAGVHGDALSILSALTLGEKDAMSREVRESFAAAGSSHILAVSGLHTGIIYALLIALLTVFGRFRPSYDERKRQIAQSAIIITGMWLYAYLTGLSPSVIRAVLMLTIFETGTALHRVGNAYNTVAAAAVISLLADPLALFSLSFQLSFAAVVAILYFVPRFDAVFPWHHPASRYIRDIFTVSLAAQIGTFPITLYYFGYTSNYFLLTNLVVLPMAFILVVGGIILLVLASTSVGGWIGVAMQWLLDMLNGYVGWIEQLPASTTSLVTSMPMMLMLFAAIAFASIGFARNRLAWLSGTVVAMLLFCYMHYISFRATESVQQVVTQGYSVYHQSGRQIDHYKSGRLIFFHYGDSTYVYTPKSLSPSREQRLVEFSQQRGIRRLTESTHLLYSACIQTEKDEEQKRKAE